MPFPFGYKERMANWYPIYSRNTFYLSVLLNLITNNEPSLFFRNSKAGINKNKHYEEEEEEEEEAKTQK